MDDNNVRMGGSKAIGSGMETEEDEEEEEEPDPEGGDVFD